MTSLWPRIEPLLAKVQKPARYIGCEDGARVPAHDGRAVAWLLVYPDAYEVGLPNQGLQILYEILNERDDAVAERAYAPWVDLEALMRTRGVPLFSVDTHRPAPEFDLLAFNLSAELVYTNLLNCIDLAGVPVRAAERGPDHPLVCVGGHCTYNPEPIADFVDLVVLGDGEEVVGELTEVVHDRLNVEVFRGCTRGCRFCQAGMITRPVRERPAEQVRTMVERGLARTGYDEVALTSLSTADFSGIEQVVADTVNGCG